MPKLEIMGEILEIIKQHNVFLISSHINPDGDAIGSQLAFYSLLSDLGKKVFIVNTDSIPDKYCFLHNVFKSVNFIIDDASIAVSQDCEVAIILDCGNLDRVGKNLAANIHPEYALINIDHHSSNDYFGTHNLVDLNASATAEIVFNLLKHDNLMVGKERAVCLYTAILTDTGCFKYANTTAETHKIAAQLIEEGIQPDQIAQQVYETIPYQKARLFSMALETLQLSYDEKIAWMTVTNEMYSKTGTVSADTEDFIDYIRSIKDVKVAILFRETENKRVKVSLRSREGFTVDQIAAAFGGGGHKNAAGCIVTGPLDKAINKILEAVRING